MVGVIIAIVVILLIILAGVYYYYTRKNEQPKVLGGDIKQDEYVAPPVPFMECEGDWAKLQMSCPAGRKINVTDFKYGKFDTSRCNDVGAPGLCSGIDVTSVIAAKANGLSSFSIDKDPNTYFGNDPCPGIYKQLRGSYTCV